MDNISNTITLIIVIMCFCILLYFIFLQKSWVDDRGRRHFLLSKHNKNPLLSPPSDSDWELNGTFNPAAILDDDGTVHLLYRALGADGVSRIGYAQSRDGIHFEDKSPYPVFSPTLEEVTEAKKSPGPKEYNPSYYASGGGWGGCEDPRAVRIGGKLHMTYVAFGGWDSVRMALTSIEMDDLRKARWNWKRSVFLSAPNQTSKNWVLFPELINGKYAILHSISPNILIDYVDSLDYFRTGRHLKSKWSVTGRKGFWDNWVRGAGPPPLRTDIGWLLLYHAMDREDPNKYKVGAMILDINDPTKILLRSPLPILSPEKHYENDGKPGVVYASGAIIKDDKLMVYYGGGDRHVCVAETPLKELLGWLQIHGSINS